MGPAPEPRKPKVMRVSTRCRTIDELVAAFATLVDEHSLVVLTDQQRTIGSRQPFVVELADGTFVMKGEAEVVESTPPPRGRLRLRFLALDASGREVHQRMLERKQGGAGGSRATLPFGMKPLVRIPEPTGAPRDPTPPPRPAPPAPFARPVPSVPATGAPRAPSTVPTIPSRPTTHGPALGARKLPAPPPVPSVPPVPVPSIPSVPRVPPVAGAAVKPPVAVAVTDSGSSLPSFEDPPDLADRTAVDTSMPLPEAEPVVVAPPAAPSIEEAVAAVVAKPRAATAPVEGDRTPGSPYILPANPFGDVAPESLEAFVECTVYEETGQFAFGEDGLVNELAPLGDAELAPEPLTTPAFPMYGSDASAVAPPPVAAPPMIAPPMIAPPMIAPPMIAPPAPAAYTATPPSVVHAPPPPRAFTPPAPVSAAPAMPLAAPPDQQWPPFDATGSVPVALELDAPRAKRLPWKWIGIGAAVIGAIVLIIVLTSGGGSDGNAAAGTGTGTGTASASARAKAAPDAGAAVAVTVDAGVAIVAAPDAGAAVAVEAAPDAGVPPPPPIPADTCHLTLNVEPDGAHIKLAGRKIGDAPIDAAIPCENASLTIVRSHYETVIKKLKPVRGEPVVLDVKMVRPEVRVTITSTPPGAMIKVDGKSLGKAPTSTVLKGYTRVKIEATLKGYQPWSKTLEATKSTKKIVAPMKKVRSR